MDFVSEERAASVFSLFRLFSLVGMHFVKGKMEIGGPPDWFRAGSSLLEAVGGEVTSELELKTSLKDESIRIVDT